MGMYKKHYTENDIAAIKAQYNIVLGERDPEQEVTRAGGKL